MRKEALEHSKVRKGILHSLPTKDVETLTPFPFTTADVDAITVLSPSTATDCSRERSTTFGLLAILVHLMAASELPLPSASSRFEGLPASPP